MHESNPFLDAAKRLQLSPEATDDFLARSGGDPSKAYDLLRTQFQMP